MMLALCIYIVGTDEFNQDLLSAVLLKQFCGYSTEKRYYWEDCMITGLEGMTELETQLEILSHYKNTAHLRRY